MRFNLLIVHGSYEDQDLCWDHMAVAIGQKVQASPRVPTEVCLQQTTITRNFCTCRTVDGLSKSLLLIWWLVWKFIKAFKLLGSTSAVEVGRGLEAVVALANIVANRDRLVAAGACKGTYLLCLIGDRQLICNLIPCCLFFKRFFHYFSLSIVYQLH